jgi:raffinose/stachyose/melibiose transport system permease protein
MKTGRGGPMLSGAFAYVSALVFVLPIYVLVNLAIRPVDDLSSAIAPTRHPTLQNFSDAWSGSSIGSALVTSTIVTTLSSIGVLVCSVMAAYPLARSTARLSNAVFYLFLIGLLLPFQVASLPLYTTMRDLHLLGTVWSLILYYTGLLLPFSVFLVTTFLRTSVATEYEEAAWVDGCGHARTFLHIVVPLLRPVLGTLIILNGVAIWNDFFTPLLYLIGSERTTVPVALYQFVGVFNSQWPLIFAGLIISMLPVLTVYLAFQRYVIRGFAGGLKG